MCDYATIIGWISVAMTVANLFIPNEMKKCMEEKVCDKEKKILRNDISPAFFALRRQNGQYYTNYYVQNFAVKSY